MAESPTITEAEILDAVVSPSAGGLSPECARAMIELKFNDAAVQRMNHLAEKNRLATINETEHAELEKYLRVGSFLNLLQAKARLSLRRHDPAA